MIPGGDHLALSQRLTQLISQPELRERLGQQAATYARQYSWERISNRMMDLYAGVLKVPVESFSVSEAL